MSLRSMRRRLRRPGATRMWDRTTALAILAMAIGTVLLVYAALRD